MSRGLGSLTLDLVAKIGGFVGPLDKAERELWKRSQNMQKSAKQLGLAIGTTLAAGATAAATALSALTLKAINYADQVNDMAAKVGISTEALSAWGYAAQMSGTDIESLSSALPRLAKNIAAASDEGSAMGNLFKTLGVDVKDASGNLRSVESLLPEIATKFKSLENDTLKADLAMKLFGKTGADLVQFLDQGADGLGELGDRARELGIIIDSQTAEAAGHFNDRLDDLKFASLGLGTDIAAKLLPALNETLDKFLDLTKQGDLAANAVTIISAAMSAGVGVIQWYNRAVAETTAGIAAMVGYAQGLGGIFQGLNISGFLQGGTGGQVKSILGGIKQVKDARKGFFDEMAAYDKSVASGKSGALFSDSGAIPASMLNPEAPKLDPKLQARLNALLAEGSGGGSKKARKSDAEKEAERLLELYERTKASMSEQIALFGQTTEVARMSYALQNGELSKLNQAQKDELLLMAQKIDLQAADAEREKKMADDIERQREQFEQVNDSILMQIDLLGKTADEQEVIHALASAGVEAESARGQEIAANISKLQQMSGAMSDQVYLMDSVRDAGADFLFDFTSGSKSFKDSMLDALDSVHKRILQMISERLMEQLFGKPGDPGGGSAGNWLGNIFGTLFGGGRANGGAVDSNTLYRVNENGPELLTVSGKDYLMMGANAGRVTPNRGGFGGGGSLSQTFVVNGAPDKRTREQLARTSGREAQRGMARTGR